VHTQELPQQSPAVQDAGSGGTLPFSGTTTYKADYVPKEGFPVMPPLTGAGAVLLCVRPSAP